MSTGNSCAQHDLQHHYENKKSILTTKQTDLIFCVSNDRTTKDDTTVKAAEERRLKFDSQRSRSVKNLFFKAKNSESHTDADQSFTNSRKSKLGSLVSKHILPIRFVNSLKDGQKKPIPPNISCPDLNRQVSSLSIDLSIRPKSANYPLFDKQLQSDTVSESSQKTKIKTRNLLSPRTSTSYLFTTSFTHSIPKEQCRSAQELQKNSVSVFKQKLKRSYSDQPNIGKTRSPTFKIRARETGSNLSLNISNCLQSKMFRNEHVSQLLDYLYIGSVESAYNEPLLCKLKIDSLVDMSNMSASQVPSNKKLHCPCLCGNEARHFRSRLIIRLDDKEDEDIEQYCEEINKFIDSSKRCGRKVLIFSYHGNSRAPAAAIQYMMKQEEFLLRQAYNLVKNQRPSVEINQGFQDILEALERRLFPEAKPSVSFGNDYLNIADPQAIKCAWIDCDT